MTIIKMIIGILIFLSGIYWYIGFDIFDGKSNLDSLITVFSGIFGIVLIITGFVMVFLLYENMKWEKKEKEHNIKRDEKSLKEE